MVYLANRLEGHFYHVNITNRFLRVFSKLDTPIRSIFPKVHGNTIFQLDYTLSTHLTLGLVNASFNWVDIFQGPGRYSDRSLFRQLDIPTGRCSDRSIFRQTGRYSDRSLFRQVDIPTGRYSDRSIFRQTGRYSDRSIVRQTGRYSDRSIIRQTGSIFRKVFIPTVRYSDIKIIVMRGLTTINSYCGDE